MAPLLVVHALSKSYLAGAGQCRARVRVLRDVTLVVRAGDRLVIAGPAGAGKTTLLHCIVGLRRPDGGSVSWSGASLPNIERWRHLCRHPDDVQSGDGHLLLADVDVARQHAARWQEVLARDAHVRRALIIVTRWPGDYAHLADAGWDLRDGVLQPLFRTLRPRQVAEPVEGARGVPLTRGGRGL